MTERDAAEKSLELLLANETMPPDAIGRTLELVDRQRAQHQAPRPLKLPRRRFVQLMAACLALGALGAGGVALAAETAQVEIDGAVTVELGVNRWGTVVRATCSNAAAAAVIDGLALVGKPCSEALCILVDDPAAREAVSGDSAVSLVAVCQGTGQREALLGDCESAAAAFGHGSTCAAASEEVRREALDAGMGVARYQVFLQINALDPSMTLERCQTMPMRELRQLLARLEGTETTQGADGNAGQGHGRHAGQGGGRGQGRGWARGQGQGACDEEAGEPSPSS